jgi:hypothetical protein
MQATHFYHHNIYDGMDYRVIFTKLPLMLWTIKGIGHISQAGTKNNSPMLIEHKNYKYFTIRFQQYRAGKTVNVSTYFE